MHWLHVAPADFTLKSAHRKNIISPAINKAVKGGGGVTLMKGNTEQANDWKSALPPNGA